MLNDISKNEWKRFVEVGHISHFRVVRISSKVKTGVALNKQEMSMYMSKSSIFENEINKS
jgi:hypothetical protein